MTSTAATLTVTGMFGFATERTARLHVKGCKHTTELAQEATAEQRRTVRPASCCTRKIARQLVADVSTYLTNA